MSLIITVHNKVLLMTSLTHKKSLPCEDTNKDILKPLDTPKMTVTEMYRIHLTRDFTPLPVIPKRILVFLSVCLSKSKYLSCT